MVFWNYRIIKTTQEGKVTYKIHEVYYDDNGKIKGWTTEPVLPCGENVDELREDIFYFLQALRQPIFELKEEDGKGELIEIKEEQPLNRGHYFEFLDRTFVAMEYIYQFLGCHPVLRKEKKLREIYQKVEKLMAELYQEAGQLEFEIHNEKEWKLG